MRRQSEKSGSSNRTPGEIAAIELTCHRWRRRLSLRAAPARTIRECATPVSTFAPRLSQCFRRSFELAAGLPHCLTAVLEALPWSASDEILPATDNRRNLPTQNRRDTSIPSLPPPVTSPPSSDDSPHRFHPADAKVTRARHETLTRSGNH